MPIKTSFNAGEFSDLMDGSVDLEKQPWSCKVLQNVIALKQGPAVRRGPTVFVNEVKDSSKRTHLIRFVKNEKEGYIIEVGDQYFRFYKNYEQLASGGPTYELATPYLQADLFDNDGLFQIHYLKQGSTTYLVHGSYAPRALVRTSDTSWSLSTLTLSDGPYLDVNETSTTLALSATSGSVTVTASAPLFTATDVGRLIRWKDPANNWTWLTITGYTDTTHVTATISGANASATTATVNWRLGIFSATTGYPRTIGFFQDRLGLISCSAYPDTYALSKIGGYSTTTLSFQQTNSAGTVADDNAIVGNMPSGEVNDINAVYSDPRGFVFITTKEEFVLRASTLGEKLTPDNATITSVSAVGGAYIQPVRTLVGASYVQTSRKKLFDMIYNIERDSLTPIDDTLSADHLTRSRLTSICYQQEPVNVIWGVKQDGALVAMTHYPLQQIWAWHRHYIGGYSDIAQTEPAIVEAVQTIPSPDGDKDDLWLIVRRVIDGQTKRYIEYMKSYYEDDIDLVDYACVDCQFSYSGVATATMTGLSALEGQTVKVMIDGRSHPNLTVTGGEITLANNRTAEKIICGLPYTWRVVTQRYEGRTQNYDTAQGKKKRIVSFVVRLLNTLGLSYGQPGIDLVDYSFTSSMAYDTSPSLFTGDTEDLISPGGTDTDGQIELSSESVFPACVVAIMPTLKVLS